MLQPQLAASPATVSGTPSHEPSGSSVPSASIDLYLLPCVRGRYDLARCVACESSLVMQLPLIEEPRLRVEAPALGEGSRQGVAGTSRLLPHMIEDSLAGLLPPL